MVKIFGMYEKTGCEKYISQPWTKHVHQMHAHTHTCVEDKLVDFVNFIANT